MFATSTVKPVALEGAVHDRATVRPMQLALEIPVCGETPPLGGSGQAGTRTRSWPEGAEAL